MSTTTTPATESQTFCVEYDLDVAAHFVWHSDDQHQQTAIDELLAVEPSTLNELQELGDALLGLARTYEQEATDETDDATAAQLFRRARMIRQAGEHFSITDDAASFYSQMCGDEQVAELVRLLKEWDVVNRGRSWSTNGPRVSAVDAYDHAMLQSRGGYDGAELEIDEGGLRLTFSGYGCDVSDIELVVHTGDVVDQLNDWDLTLDEIEAASLIEIESPGVCRFVLDNLDGLLGWGSDVVALMHECMGISTGDRQRVAETVAVLGVNWTGTDVELVRASAALVA